MQAQVINYVIYRMKLTYKKVKCEWGGKKLLQVV